MITPEERKERERLWSRMIKTEFPQHAVSDWENTNHYEIQGNTSGSFFWLTLTDIDPELRFESMEGQRVGLIMDLAVWAAKELRNSMTSAARIVDSEPT